MNADTNRSMNKNPCVNANTNIDTNINENTRMNTKHISTFELSAGALPGKHSTIPLSIV